MPREPMKPPGSAPAAENTLGAEVRRVRKRVNTATAAWSEQRQHPTEGISPLLRIRLRTHSTFS